MPQTPALKRVIGVETLSWSAKALLPRINEGAPTTKSRTLRDTVLLVATYTIRLLPIAGAEDDTLLVQPFPEKIIEIGMLVAGAVGLLILIAPNFGLKPKQTVDGWRFPVKPTCLLLYYLALTGGIGAVAFGAAHLLASGNSNWIGWTCFGIGFFVVPVVLADWPEPLILDGQGLIERGCASTRIRWQELKHVRAYRIRCDRGVVIHGAEGKELVVADIAYDSEAVLDCLLQWRPVPYYSLQDEMRPVSILNDHYSQW